MTDPKMIRVYCKCHGQMLFTEDAEVLDFAIETFQATGCCPIIEPFELTPEAREEK